MANRDTRRRIGRACAATLLLGSLMFTNLTSSGAVDEKDFELDGNTADDPAGVPFDWVNFFEADSVTGDISKKASLPDGFSAAGAVADYALPDSTTFTTGSKDTLNISTGWDCTTRNNVGDKVDHVNSYSVVYEDNGDTILYFGTEISSPNGSSNVAFWFLQDQAIDCSDAPGGGGTDFTGDHTDGDLLVVAAFSDGGRTANVNAYEWEGGASGSLNTTPIGSGALCVDDPADPPADQDVCAITNADSAITTPWNSPDKDGGNLNAQEFFEGGVNLTELGLLDKCFAKFLSNTRSSPSLTSTIFDYTLGELEVCDPSTDISVSADNDTIFSGDSVTLTISETNDGNIALTEPTVGYVTTDNTNCAPTDVDVLDNDDPDPTADPPETDGINDGDTDENGDLDPGETWLFECTFTPDDSVTVTVYGHGIFDDGTNPPLDVTWVDACAGDDGEIGPYDGTDDETDNPVNDDPEAVDTDDPPDDVDDVLCDADEFASVEITRLAPGTSLKKTASATITYTYAETNEGNAALTEPDDTGKLPGELVDSNGDLLLDAEEPPAPLYDTENGGWVEDDECSPVLHVLGIADADDDSADPLKDSDPMYNIGDVGDPDVAHDPDHETDPTEDPAENNNKLDPGETWYFTCEYELAGPDESADPPETESSVTNVAIGHGIIDSDDSAIAKDITWCEGDPTDVEFVEPAGVRCDQDERDVVTVTITYGNHTTGLEE